MDRTQRQAVLLSLIQRLADYGSWCGETHLQKSAFFLQELMRVPLGLNVIFYKFGPYSFDLSDEITALRADLLVSVKSRQPYGPSLVPTENAEQLIARCPRTLALFGRQIAFVAQKLGAKGVAELERLATALYVSLQRPDASDEVRAGEISRLKPHLTIDEARKALTAVHEMQSEAASVSLAG